MRGSFLLLILFSTLVLKAQTVSTGLGNAHSHNLSHNKLAYDSTQKKWFVSSYLNITAGYSFFRGGNSSFIAAPIGLQLNRRLTNNLYAFAGVSLAPAYVNVNRAFVNADMSKVSNNKLSNYQNTRVYSSVSLGLMYINDARTFSISGSFSVEKSNYPMYYYNPVNTTIPNKPPSYK